MGVVFVQNAHDKAMQQFNDWNQVDCPRIIEINKFALRAFYCLANNREISGFLAANTLFGLQEYYTSEKTLKRVNMRAFQLYFPKIIFQDAKDEEAAESLIPYSTLTMMPTSIFDDYYIIIREKNLTHILYMII